MTRPGRSARAAGHEWERQVAAYLKAATGLDVRTTRAVRAGVQAASDLSTVVDNGFGGHDVVPGVAGWAIECKRYTSSAIPSWVEQAQQAAKVERLGVFAVVSWAPGVGKLSTASARVFTPRGMLYDHLTFGELSPGGYDSSDYVEASLGFLTELLRPPA
jgi:hypothetical protein